jgi:lipopolysaccharide export LptBFGC system permease protein LptF
LWVSNMGISAMFLSQHVLESLAGSNGVFNKNSYRTWIQVRYSLILSPTAMSVLASSMSLLLIATVVSPQALMGIILAGYAGHISSRAFSLLGSYGYVPPVIAGWLTPLLQLSAAILLLTAASWWRSPRRA